jgi:hypothetical protein
MSGRVADDFEFLAAICACLRLFKNIFSSKTDYLKLKTNLQLTKSQSF